MQDDGSGGEMSETNNFERNDSGDTFGSAVIKRIIFKFVRTKTSIRQPHHRN